MKKTMKKPQYEFIERTRTPAQIARKKVKKSSIARVQARAELPGNKKRAEEQAAAVVAASEEVVLLGETEQVHDSVDDIAKNTEIQP